MAKEKFYAVQKGNETGVYRTWAEAQAQVSGVPGAVYKSFTDASSAQSFLHADGYGSGHGSSSAPKPSYSSSTFYSAPAEPSYSPPSRQASCVAAPRRTAPAPGPRATTRSMVKSKSNYSSGPTPRHKSAPVANKSFYGVNFSDGSSQIYSSWPECQAAVKNQRGVTYKKFPTVTEAQTFTSCGATPALCGKKREASVQSYLQNHSRTQLDQQRSKEVERVYMDGSYMNKKAGYGVYFGPDDSRNISGSIHGKEKDSYVAEVHATKNALRAIHNEIQEFKQGKRDTVGKYTLATDSETAIGLLDNYTMTWSDKEFATRKAGSELKEAVKLYKDVKQFYHENSAILGDHEFKIDWVKGHHGILGNEAADQLAKQGAMNS